MTPNVPWSSAFRDAVERAGQAPSSHNSQPWGLAHVESPEARQALAQLLPGTPDPDASADHQHVLLALDTVRAIRALPSLDVEMNVSCAMFLELLLGELEARGWRGTTRWLESPALDFRLPSWPSAWRPLCAVSLAPAAPRPQPASSPRPRITNRAPYRSTPVDPGIIAELSSLRSRLTADAEVAQRVAVVWIHDPDQIRAVGQFVGQHAGVDFGHSAAWRETYRFIRFGRREADAAEDGFSITQLLGPLSPWRRRCLQIILSPASMSVLKWFGFHNHLGRQLGELVAGTPLLAAIALRHPDGGLRDQMIGGSAAMDLWLRATANHLVMHPVSVILQHDTIRAEFQRRFNVPGRVLLFCRVGYPTVEFPPSPRRWNPLAAVIRL
jgi:nitroreductase